MSRGRGALLAVDALFELMWNHPWRYVFYVAVGLLALQGALCLIGEASG